MSHGAVLLVLRQGPDLRARLRDSYGLNARQMNAWMYEGNGEADARVLCQGQHRQFRDGQYRRADGRLVSQGDQVGGRPEGPEVPAIGGFGGKVIAKTGVRYPRTYPLEKFIRPREEHPASTPPNGWSRNDDLKLGPTRWRRTTTTPAGGRRPTTVAVPWNQKSYDSLTPEYKAWIVEAASTYAGRTCSPSTTTENPAALKQLPAGGAKVQRFPKDVMEALVQGRGRGLCRIECHQPGGKKIYDDYITYRRDANLWFRFTESGFDDFMQQQQFDPSSGAVRLRVSPLRRGSLFGDALPATVGRTQPRACAAMVQLRAGARAAELKQQQAAAALAQRGEGGDFLRRPISSRWASLKGGDRQVPILPGSWPARRSPNWPRPDLRARGLVGVAAPKSGRLLITPAKFRLRHVGLAVSGCICSWAT